MTDYQYRIEQLEKQVTELRVECGRLRQKLSTVPRYPAPADEGPWIWIDGEWKRTKDVDDPFPPP